VDTDWLVPLLLEREPVAPDRAAEALAEAWDALREEAALAGVPAARVDRAQVLRRLGLAGPPGAAPPPERPGDRLRRAAVDVVCAAGRLYDAR
jgi:hypothetical protein